MITPAQAETLLRTRGFHGKTASAVFAHLTTDITQSEAAKLFDVGPAAVSRMLKKLSVIQQCPCCGHDTRRLKP